MTLPVKTETQEQVASNIQTIRTTGKTLDAMIHATAIQCMLHAYEHGNLTLATNLVSAMPKSSRRKALIVWFTTLSPVVFSEKNEKFTMLKGKKKDSHDGFNLSKAYDTPFWDLTEEVVKPVDLDKVDIVAHIDQKIKSLQKYDDEGRAFVGKRNLEQTLTELRLQREVLLEMVA